MNVDDVLDIYNVCAAHVRRLRKVKQKCFAEARDEKILRRFSHFYWSKGGATVFYQDSIFGFLGLLDTAFDKGIVYEFAYAA